MPLFAPKITRLSPLYSIRPTLRALDSMPLGPHAFFQRRLSSLLFFINEISHCALTASLEAPRSNLSWETEILRACSRYNSIAVWPCGNQSTGATLTASAQLNPQLKPAWYARGNVITNSPSRCTERYTGTPSCFNSEGENWVTWKEKKMKKGVASSALEIKGKHFGK